MNRLFNCLNNIPKDFTGQYYIHNIQCMVWIYKGMFHHTTEPALVYSNGGMEYRVFNKRHRIGGPCIHWGKLNDIRFYYINNIPYTEEDYWQQPELIKFKLNRILTEL